MMQGEVNTESTPPAPSSNNLSTRVISGSFWIFSLRMFQRVIAFARLVVVARILSPNDLGMMAIVLLTMSFLEAFSETGMHAALVQKRDRVQDFLDSAWSFLVIRGLVQFLTLFLLAPFIAAFFNAPETEPVIQAVSISYFIQGLTNIGVILFQKELDFRQEFTVQATGTFVDVAVSIALVFFLRNIWALALGLIVGKLVRCIMSYLVHPYRPRFKLGLKETRELIDFGKWVFVSNLVTFFLTKGDDAFVGRVLSVTTLGFYEMAYKISNLPTTEISQIVGRVTFPLYAMIQGEKERLKTVFLRVSRMITTAAIPLVGFIFVLSKDYIEVILGTKWAPAVPIVKILGVFGLSRTLISTFGSFIQGIGQPKASAKITSLQLLLMAVFIFPFSERLGVNGVALAITLPSLLTLFLLFLRIAREMELTHKEYLPIVVFPLLCTAVMTLAISTVREALSLSQAFEMVALTFLGAVIYLAAFESAGRFFGFDSLVKTWETLRPQRTAKETGV